MEELRLWIKDVGFPIACACASMWAVFQLFKIRERERAGKDDKLATAICENTAEMKEQTAYLKKFGSDPRKLCQADKIKEELHEFEKRGIKPEFEH